MPLILNNISLKDYFELEFEERFEYDFAMRHAKQFNSPNDIFNIGDLTELEFGLIKDLQHDFSEGITWIKLIEYIRNITGKNEKEIGAMKLINLSMFASYIRSEIERINEIESNLLFSPADGEEEEAGIENFNKFGSYTQLRKLCNSDLTKLDKIKKIKYSICLMELLYQKTDYEFKTELYRIRTKK